MSATEPEPTEAELRAAYEAEIKQIRVEHVLLEQVVTLVNLGMRRTGLAPGTEGERDPAQVRLAIEAIRALVPMLEQSAPEQIPPIREALSQLQLGFVRIGGQPGDGPSGSSPGSGAASPGAAGTPPQPPASPLSPDTSAEPSGTQPGTTPEPPQPGQAGPAQRSGRLWIPGQ